MAALFEDSSMAAPVRGYQRIVAGDEAPPPPDMRETSCPDLGLDGPERSRFFDRGFQRLEQERMWSRVWQYACREEELPEPGDFVTYDIGPRSYIVLRATSGEIKAFENSCLHRGTRLCSGAGYRSMLRCPFHGFTWSLEGELVHVPARWDFPHIVPGSHSLPEARVGTWGGFVFINPDREAAPLETYLEDIPAHFAACRLEDKYVVGNYRKILPANWKLAFEAFLEALHLPEAHPQVLSFVDNVNTQYDILPGRRHTSRFLSPVGVQSPDYAGTLSEQEILTEAYAAMDAPAPALPEGISARAKMAECARAGLAAKTGRDYADLSDAEMIDAIQYQLFPNMVLLRGPGFPVVYRVRPNGDDPQSCIFDLMILGDVPAGDPRPDPAPLMEMGDGSFTDLPEMINWSGMVYDQDTAILHDQQLGMTAGSERLIYSRYQESRLRHFHDTLTRYVEAS